jgi:putative acetyltransferase
MAIFIRDFCTGDEADLSRVFQSSIRELAYVDYTTEQIEAWAGATLNFELWVERIRELKPFVVEIDGFNSE